MVLLEKFNKTRHIVKLCSFTLSAVRINDFIHFLFQCFVECVLTAENLVSVRSIKHCLVHNFQFSEQLKHTFLITIFSLREMH